MEELQDPIVPEMEKQEAKKPVKPAVVLAISVFSLLVALCALVVAFVIDKPQSSDSPVTATAGKITIAWIDSDTILENYLFLKEVDSALVKYEEKLQNQLLSSYTAYQNMYEDYMTKASAYKLSLDEQKKTEAKLAEMQQALPQLEAQLSQQLAAEKMNKQIEVHDSIAKFVARYNKKYQYTFILQKSIGGSLIWGDTALDITRQVLKGLNDEYLARQKEKE
jgi:outer membrane protein